jgi:pimeloyl-ACP methyl ester carboxylesterase
VVRADDSSLSPADVEAMPDRERHAKLVELVDAKHDLHLDRPAEWREAVSDFLDSLDSEASSAE